MKRVLVIVIALVLSVVALPPTWADNQPGQGETSTDRNPAGFGGGPHCHVLIVDSANEQFDVRVFPSHTGHANSRTGVMAADLNCDGVPG